MKCQCCKTEEATWAWQPFGPAEDASCFTTLGAHYRGFPVVKICPQCKSIAQNNQPVEFVLNGILFIGTAKSIHRVPAYVGDPLAWWEQLPAEKDA